MASGVTGSVSVALHPLVILNISDHWIRIRSQEGRPMQGKRNVFTVLVMSVHLPSLSLHHSVSSKYERIPFYSKDVN